MEHSPELTGGEGFTFEGEVSAYYLTALLAEASAPGIDDRNVVGVSVQQRAFGEPLDDVIVDFNSDSNSPARLSLQVKRSLIISSAELNKDFQEVIRDSWLTLNKQDFRLNIDRYGVAVGTVAIFKERAIKTLCDWARESPTTAHFQERFRTNGNVNRNIKAVKKDVETLLDAAKGTACSIKEVHRFLSHFVLIRFDFLREGAVHPSEAINRIQECISPDDSTNATVVWSRVTQLARSSAGKAGQFDRTRLVYTISPLVRLRGGRTLRPDLDMLTQLANNYSNLIPDDIGGLKLKRTELLESLDTMLTETRAVQVRGLPGSGKSVLMKHAVQGALQNGPVLFLKAEQLEGTSWTSYAKAQGLSNVPLEELLVEIGATGTSVLFIDAIDRVDIRFQPIVVDVIHTIIKSPLLNEWRVVVSLRDTGIEMLRNWLGDLLDSLSVNTLHVGQLNDDDADRLADDRPHLRPLLFGTTQVREIVRRPFFLKVLTQSYMVDTGTSTFVPQSELDLIENWWQRGGFNETGQTALERQRALLDLATVHARQLSKPISFRDLKSVDHIESLKSDGILQNYRDGVSVRFAHDIFFEWAFFHVLLERGTDWPDAVKSCGEPPAVARTVELASQWEYVTGENWSMLLAQAEGCDLRSQWLRAWLIGPLGNSKFEIDSNKFATVAFANNFRLFRKTLVWFQAEKTAPNKKILTADLPPEKRQRFADFLGIPSGFAAWRRLIAFILWRRDDIPQRLFPEIVEIFEVWQNAFADFSNPASKALLSQCASWVASIDAINHKDKNDTNSAYWREVPRLNDLRKSLVQLLLRSSASEPSLSLKILQRTAKNERIRYDTYHDIIAYSPILAQTLPGNVVELSLRFLQELLPDQQVARDEQRFHDSLQRRQEVQSEPETEHTLVEKVAHAGGVGLPWIGHFSYYDWEKLSIHDDLQSFWPPSPLREPFNSLFQSSPDDALKLLCDLCNHAMTAWRQLHRYSRDRPGTPISLELTFPWGTQTFWGTEREYLWFRSMWAPKAIACAFMALEEWCFKELERKRPVDELIQQIVDGNTCIAILGVASMIALHTETLSETTLPLVTSQRLLAADQNRMTQEASAAANLMGFKGNSDQSHIDVIRRANARIVRKKQLVWMVSRFMFTESPLRDQARELILNFKNELPFQYEEQRNNAEERKRLTKQAIEYAELADLANYKAYRIAEDSDELAIVHISPSAADPESLAEADKAKEYLKHADLWTWAAKSFEGHTLDVAHALGNAIQSCKESDSIDLFEYQETENTHLEMRRRSVAAVASVVLNFREGCTEEELEWARGILRRAIRLQERVHTMWSASSAALWHHGIYVARGLAADIREGTAKHYTANDLLEMIAHPVEVVSMTALKESCLMWQEDSKLTWASLLLANSLCYHPLMRQEPFLATPRPPKKVRAPLRTALKFYKRGKGWLPLPLPPQAWEKVEHKKSRHAFRRDEMYDASDLVNSDEVWKEPDLFWDSKRASSVLQQIPVSEVLNSSAKCALLDFLDGVLDWTIEKNSPSWLKPGSRGQPMAQIYQLTDVLGSTLGCVGGLLPLGYFQDRFLNRILSLEGDNCWALLAPLTHRYVCAYIYDAHTVSEEAVELLNICLDRLLVDSSFKRGANSAERFSSIQQSELVRTLMFVSVEHVESATRYVNGDWSEINQILPLIDRFIRARGLSTLVMDPFLTLCERAKAHYPVESFADQILSIIGSQPDELSYWHGTFIPARIAELVQHFANRDAPLKLDLAQRFLRILDLLVDMGDRRSAALQLDEAFREIQVPFDPS